MMGSPRVAVVGDVPEILRLGQYMYATVDARVDAAWRDLARAQFASRLGGDLFGWVIDDESDEGVLAACGFVNSSPRLPLPSARSSVRGYIQWVVTDPGAQGRGFAKAIMGAIMEWAVAESVDVLELHASPAARRLYETLGFGFSPDIDYPPEVLGAPMRWSVRGNAGGPARPARRVGGDA